MPAGRRRRGAFSFNCPLARPVLIRARFLEGRHHVTSRHAALAAAAFALSACALLACGPAAGGPAVDKYYGPIDASALDAKLRAATGARCPTGVTSCYPVQQVSLRGS